MFIIMYSTSHAACHAGICQCLSQSMPHVSVMLLQLKQ